MKRSGVALRLLPLLDITLILLGMFMLMLAQTQMAASNPDPPPPTHTALGYQFVYVYYGTAGAERGRSYTMNNMGHPDKEIVTPEDFDDYLRANSPAVDRQKTVILLFISDEGFDTLWDESRHKTMEEECGLQVRVIYNYRTGGNLQ